MNTNIFNNIPTQLPEELFQSLLKRGGLHIERIVSQGHVTPAGQWYDQTSDEWVLLLQGQALIVYPDHQSIRLMPGDYLLIPAHKRHRVEWTQPDVDTIWLAVHLPA
ncbi:MAG: cupin domain-containing protein [Methylobacter sp.]|nr:cupin domain-containing protein [Methylobacter sp.]MDP2099037.1 cupin domain-containing protein [Methylobacter sp.]MDP2428258.1 cupin domain-containing protein [Methylobacter sp.]MDP3055225.1 cupin domain-containing protein [Methylobacter sp.]MDP3362070.1 cupin domain-containing protein [Methylobacter sp.]